MTDTEQPTYPATWLIHRNDLDLGIPMGTVLAKMATDLDPADIKLSYDVGNPAALAADNTIRARMAAYAVASFYEAFYDDEHAGTVIGDLLGNLHHLVDALGLDWDLLTTAGERHYADELAGLNMAELQKIANNNTETTP